MIKTPYLLTILSFNNKPIYENRPIEFRLLPIESNPNIQPLKHDLFKQGH